MLFEEDYAKNYASILYQCLLRSQGGRLTGKKEYLVWRQIVHLVTKGWSVISTESLPRLVFTELSSVTQTPRLQRHWKSSVSGRSEADDKTTKSDDSARKGAPLAPSELPSDGAHCAHLHSVSSTLRETVFVVVWPYQIKRNCLSFFWKTGLVLWMSNNIYAWLVVVGTFSQSRFMKCIQW